MTESLEDLRTFIEYQVREGFESVHEIIENAQELAHEKYEGRNLLPEIKRFTAESLAAHRGQQAAWGPSTDCDRLDEAFADLNRQGIVARQDFSCCNNCGFTEIWDEVEAVEEQQPVKGYVFYHLQSTESAIQTGQLLMAYGSVEDDPIAFQRIGSDIVAELRRVGLNASWGGTPAHPIVVDGIVWQRRRKY